MIENRQVGPFFSFGVRAEARQPFLVLLAPGKGEEELRTELQADGRTLNVCSATLAHTVRLPQAGTTDSLPQIHRA